MRIRSSIRSFAFATMLTAAMSCGGSTDNTTNADTQLAIAILTGNTQTATVGQSLSTKPTVKVTDKNGVAKPNVTVTFAITAGAGSITGGSQTTAADGTASVGTWTLSTTAGANTLTATVKGATGSPVTFSATGTAAAAASTIKAAGDAISSAAGVAVSARPSVAVKDQFGNPVSGVNVTFAVASGGGSATGTSATTDATGTATVGAWTLGVAPATNTMTATVAGVAGTVTFTATGVVGPLASLVKVAGDNQTVLVNTLLPIAPSVRAQDQFGNVISGAAVTFAVLTGAGNATGASQSTGVNGTATVGGWTIGAIAGTNTLQASASGATATFTATGLAAFNAQQYVGIYAGTWTNTTFASTGTGNAVVAVNGANSIATITVNVTGNVLGTGGITNAVNNGAFAANGASFTGNVFPMGNITASISANGVITASGANIPNGQISSWTASGTVTATTLQLSFVVNFFTGSPAFGTITMTKP